MPTSHQLTKVMINKSTQKSDMVPFLLCYGHDSKAKSPQQTGCYFVEYGTSFRDILNRVTWIMNKEKR